MAYGLLLLRVVVGLAFVGHGSQKLFGWFGGHGPKGTAGFMSSLGFRSPALMALAAGLSELGGGLLLALGLLTPAAALALTVVMLNAIATVHWTKGFWNGNGGYELNLTFLTVAIAVAATGPGRFSLDRAIGWENDVTGLWWAVGVLVAAAVVSGLTLTAGRESRAPEQQPA